MKLSEEQIQNTLTTIAEAVGLLRSNSVPEELVRNEIEDMLSVHSSEFIS